MKSSYKVVDLSGIYFVSSTIIEWIPIFTSEKYFRIIINSLNFCKTEKDLKLFYYVIMDNHFHLIVSHPKLSDVMRSLKGYTADRILDELKNDNYKWKYDLMKFYKKKHKITNYQIWQEGFHPQMISSVEMLNQKIEYVHYNPVKRGFVNNPYNMIGEITVPAGETLEIQAGVELIAMGNYRITALGNILSIGTQNNSIRFHGNNGLNWGGLRLENETIQSTFNYCRISNTDDINDYGIHSLNSPVLVNHSYIDDHQKGVHFSALTGTTPSLMEIKNSKVAYCQKNGILITDNSNVLVDSCEVTQCGLGTSFYAAIQLALQNSSHNCSPTISNSYIHHNGKQGITMGNLFNYNEMAPTVENNIISYNYTGIYLYNAKGYYAHNHIHHNFEENNADSGAGVMLYGSGANGTFTYNEITGNYTGFYLTDGATANLGDLENTSTDDDGYNCIYDNIFYTGEEFTVYNASAMDVKAENTVWDDDPPIDVSIIDGNDNPAYGIVDYEPTLSPYAPPASLFVSVSGNTVIIEIPFGTAYPTLPLNLEGCNLYEDGVLIAELITSPLFIIPFVSPGEHTYGATYVYEGYHESTITDTTIYIPHILNPPTNVSVSLQSGLMTWEEPEIDSTSPFLYYNVYLDGYLDGTTTDLFWQYTGLVWGQTYIAEVSAVYEAGESELIEATWFNPVYNPPSNASYEIFPDHIHLTWEPPVGSNVVVEEYHIYLDGELYEITTELFCDIYDLISGIEYEIALTAYYIDGIESDPIVFNILFVDSDNVLNLETKLLGNYPNPFNPTTTISFSLTAEGSENAELVIYNLKGQKVKVFDMFPNPDLSGGTREILWDGIDDSGKTVSSGVYFYKLIAGDKTFTRKMLLMK